MNEKQCSETKPRLENMYVPSSTKSPLHSVGFFQFFKLQPIWIWEKIENISRTKSKSLDLFRSFKESISELRPLYLLKLICQKKDKILLEFLLQKIMQKNRKTNCSNKSITLCSFVAGWTFKVQVQQHATNESFVKYNLNEQKPVSRRLL